MDMSSFLQELGLHPLSLAVGALSGTAITGLWLGLSLARAGRDIAALEARLDSEKNAMGDHFKALAQMALQSNNEQFLALAGERLKAANERGANDLDKRAVEIEKLVKPIEKELLRLNALSEQMQGTDKAIRHDLLSLQKETSKLSGVLRNPSAQGKWGEFVLETILDKANLVKGIHYNTQKQIEGGGKPDVIISLHDGAQIAIDSKAPINEFISRLDEDISEEESIKIQANMARAVRAHVKALGAKTYQENISGSDFVILFLPSEVVFSATLRSDPEIVDFAVDNHVVIASPTLIISLLRVVALSWRQVDVAKNAMEIANLGVDLHKRFSKFLEHFAKIGKNINAALDTYNDAVGSAERSVLPAARKFEKINNISQATQFSDVAMIDNAPRKMISEFSGDDENDNKNSPKVING